MSWLSLGVDNLASSQASKQVREQELAKHASKQVGRRHSSRSSLLSAYYGGYLLWQEYSSLLCSLWFWSRVAGETVLIFQAQ